MKNITNIIITLTITLTFIITIYTPIAYPHPNTTQYTQNEYTLTITIIGEGTITKNPDQPTYPPETIVELTALPAKGWNFFQWTGDATGTNNPLEINMTTNKSITAYFTQKHYTLTITTQGQGTIIKEPNQTTYLHSTTVNLTALPNTNWNFSHWSGNLTGTTNPTTILMDDNKSITAHFTANQDTTPPTITITKPTNGVYLLDNRIIRFRFPIIIRGVTVQVDATDNETGISHVEFYVDGTLVANDSQPPYSFVFRDFPTRKHVISAQAYDYNGNTAFDTISIWKWKFHPIVIALVALGIIYLMIT